MNNEQKLKINRFIHVDLMGNPDCDHNEVNTDKSIWSCSQCGFVDPDPEGDNDPFIVPDYTDPDAPRSLLDGAIAAAIEKVGLDTYGRALTDIGLQAGVSSDQEHGAFLLTANAGQIAEAIYLACKPENQEVENAD